MVSSFCSLPGISFRPPHRGCRARSPSLQGLFDNVYLEVTPLSSPYVPVQHAPQNRFHDEVDVRRIVGCPAEFNNGRVLRRLARWNKSGVWEDSAWCHAPLRSMRDWILRGLLYDEVLIQRG